MNNLFYQDLNLIKKDSKQNEAYKSFDNTVVIAGPGSGKTRVLTLKAVTLGKVYILKPCGLACISFSRESVRELRKRFKKYGYNPSNKDFIGTVHSFSLLHVIHPFGHLFPSYKIKYPIKILPDDVARSIYEKVLSKLKVDGWTLSLSEINRHRSITLLGRSGVKISSSDLVGQGALLYEELLSATEYLDFISIINTSAKIINEQEFVRETLRSRFPWLLIDEYQDLGKALHEMVLELVFNAGIKLYAVGDINQSIYGFNGGYPDFLKELTKRDDINSVELEGNYRSSQHIIDASLEALKPNPPIKYVSQLRQHDTADFYFIACDEDMHQQYEVVAKKIIPKLIKLNIALNEIGILTASNSQNRQMAQVLHNEKIASFIAKWDFENSAVVVWLQECAAWCLELGQSFDNIFKFWKRLLNEHNDSRKNYENIKLKVQLHTTLNRSKSEKDIYNWLKFIIEQLRLNQVLLNSQQYPDEVENLKTLLKEAELYNLKNQSLNRFANLHTPNNEVTITTRHSSKGLEFEVVILLGMEEGNFPFYKHFNDPVALDEDQRLCYVCVSRAKRSCILIRSKVFNKTGKYGPYQQKFNPSRFWIGLYQKFGNNQNTFDHNTFK